MRRGEHPLVAQSPMNSGACQSVAASELLLLSFIAGVTWVRDQSPIGPQTRGHIVTLGQVPGPLLFVRGATPSS